MLNRLLLLAAVAAAVAASVSAAPPQVVVTDSAYIITVMPGATIAFFHGWRFGGGYDAALVEDENRDGSIVLVHDFQSRSIIVVDFATGEFAAGGLTLTAGFTEQTLLPGTSGAYTEIVARPERAGAFWVRPGVGAWLPLNGMVHEGDGVSPNGLSISTLGIFSSAAGSPQSNPFTARHGDLLFVVGTDTAYGGRVDPLLDAPKKPGIIETGGIHGAGESELDRKLVLPLIRTGGSAGTVTVRCCNQSGGDAVAGLDYAPIDTVVTFAPGELVKSVSTRTLNDEVWTGDRTTVLQLHSPGGGVTLGPRIETTFRIIDDERRPEIALTAPAMVNETDGPVPVPLTVTVTGARRRPLRVVSTLSRDNAVIAQSETIFDPAETTREIVLMLPGNNTPEDDYQVHVSAALRETGGGAGAILKVVDDDPSTLVFDNALVRESELVRITPRLEPRVQKPVRFSWKTVDGSAKAGSDYVAGQGDSSTPMVIQTSRDEEVEGDEQFYVDIFDITGATPSQTRITVTIGDDDGLPLPVFSQLQAKEGSDYGQTVAMVRVTLPTPLPFPIGYQVTSSDGTAVVVRDYFVPSFAGVAFAAGQTTAEFPVYLVADDVEEPDETFILALTGTAVKATFTILNDDVNDHLPLVVIDDLKVTELTGTSLQARLRVALTAAATAPISVKYKTVAGTATPGRDYTEVEGTITFNTGEFLKEAVIDIAGDPDVEPDEQLQVTLFAPTGMKISRGTATLTIVDDDRQSGPLTVSMRDVTVTEKNWRQTVNMTIALSREPRESVVVHYTTRDGTAVNRLDFQSTSGAVGFLGDRTTTTISLEIEGDLRFEAPETFTVEITAVEGAATIARRAGTVTILDDDKPRTSKDRSVRH